MPHIWLGMNPVECCSTIMTRRDWRDGTKTMTRYKHETDILVPHRIYIPLAGVVHAVAVMMNHQYTPTDSRTTIIDNCTRVINTQWMRIEPTTAKILLDRRCNDSTQDDRLSVRLSTVLTRTCGRPIANSAVGICRC